MIKLLLLFSFLLFFLNSYSQNVDTIKTYNLDQLVITGTRIEKQKDQVPASITVVSRKEIEESGSHNVLNVLANRVPGLFLSEKFITGFGVGPASAGKISIRGISAYPANSRILVLIDGQPQYVGLFGHPVNDSYTSTDVERVEVIRGPASVLYGSNAMGGAINIITRQADKNTPLVRGRVAYGSYNTQLYSGSINIKKENSGLFAAFNRSSTDGHREDGDSDFFSNNGYLKVHHIFNPAFKVSLDGNITDAEFHDPGKVSNPLQGNFYKYKRSRSALTFDNYFRSTEGSLRFFYSGGQHKFHDGFNSNDYNWGVTFYQNLKLIKNNVITVGIDNKNYGGKAENKAPEPPKGFGKDHEITETDFYVLVQHKFFDQLNVNAGYRIISNSQFGNEDIPAFGVTWNANEKTNIKASISKGFRSPTIVDMFIFPPSNEDLEPEKNWNYEIGFERTLFERKLMLEITGFIVEGENLIQAVPTGLPGPPRNINTGTFDNSGIEVSGNYSLNKSLDLMVTYSYLDMETPLLYAPKQELNITVTYQYKFLNLSANFKHVNDLYTSMEPVTIDTYNLIDARIGAKARKWLNIFVEGRNLTDEEYSIESGYPMPGATIMVGVDVSF